MGRHVRQRTLLVAVTAVMALLVGACAGDAETTTTTNPEAATTQPDSATTQPETDATQPPADGGEIVIAQISEPPNLDAHVTTAGPAIDLFENVYDTLVSVTPIGELEPRLAASLPESVGDDRWRITLREGVTFSDGEPFNADAVVANLQRIIDLAAEGEVYDRVSSIIGAETVDELTVDIITEGTDVVLPKRLVFAYMMSPAAFGDPGFSDQAVGTGPYVLSNWDRGNELTIERNPEYWGDSPSIETATFRFLPEPATRLASLLAGEVDVVFNISDDDVDAVPNWAPAAVNGVIMLNPTIEPGYITEDQRVREALAISVDRDLMNEAFFEGRAFVPNGQIVDEPWFGYAPDLEPYEYDPERAQQLLEEAGVVGETITIGTIGGRWPKVEEVYEAAAGMWEEIGLQVELVYMETGQFVDMMGGDPARETLYGGNTDSPTWDVDHLTRWWLCESARASFCDEELDSLLLGARGELDPEQRLVLYEQALQIIRDQVYSIPFITLPERTMAWSDAVTWDGQEARVATMSISG